VVLSVYLGALRPVAENVSGWYTLLKGVAVVILIWGTLLLVGAAYGQSDILKPLPLSTGKQRTLSSEAEHVPFTLVNNLEELALKQKQALKEEKLLVIYFYKDTCPVCKKLKATTFQDEKVRAALKKYYIAVRVNITDSANKESQAIQKKFNIFGSPAFVFFDQEGKELPNSMFYGYEDPEEFYDTLDLIEN
jgi:thiol:disulfide interchange protein DsbD